jgi:hypothetical protein
MANWKLLVVALAVYLTFDWALNGCPIPFQLPW